MRRCFVFLLIASILLSVCGGAFASGEAGGDASGETAVSLAAGDWKFSRAKSEDGYTVTVTQFSGDPDENGVVVVPKILGGGVVTAVGMTAFRNTAIRAILLPDSVHIVEQWAFYDCTSLQYVTSANASVSVDAAAFQNSPAIVTGEEIADYTGNRDISALYENPLLDALGVKQGAEPYNYVAYRDIDGDGDIDVLFYADTALAASSATLTLSGKLAYPGVSGAAYSELMAGKAGRPVLDGAYLTFENAAIEARNGETVALAYTAPNTEGDSVLGRVNEERSLLWADGSGTMSVRELHGTSTSHGNWTKIRDENNSYAGQPMEVIMQWGMGAAIYASQGGIITVGDPDGARSSVYACGDGANGALATGILNEDRPSQIYVYNTDFTLEGWNNHVVDTIYGGYVYLEDVTGVTGKAGSYIMNNGSTLANDFGDGAVEVRGFAGEAWGDSSAGVYAIGSGSLVAGFADGSVWTVTHDSYLAGLTIGADAAVRAEDGHSLTMTVNGIETTIAPGSYEGEIVILVQ